MEGGISSDPIQTGNLSTASKYNQKSITNTPQIFIPTTKSWPNRDITVFLSLCSIKGHIFLLSINGPATDIKILITKLKNFKVNFLKGITGFIAESPEYQPKEAQKKSTLPKEIAKYSSNF